MWPKFRNQCNLTLKWFDDFLLVPFDSTVESVEDGRFVFLCRSRGWLDHQHPRARAPRALITFRDKQNVQLKYLSFSRLMYSFK